MHPELLAASNVPSTSRYTQIDASASRKTRSQMGSRPAKRLPIGPKPQYVSVETQDQHRTKRESVIFPQTSFSSLASWQSVNHTSSDLYPNITPSPSPSHASYPTKPVNHPSNEPTFHFSPTASPGPIHVSLPGYPSPTKGRARPNLTIKVPHNDMNRSAIIITPVENKPKPLIPVSPQEPTPISPLVFAHPTPHVIHTNQQKRKKLSKLRRHLGENVPVELVFSNARFTPSPEAPRRLPIPRFTLLKQGDQEAAKRSWNMLKTGTSTSPRMGNIAQVVCPHNHNQLGGDDYWEWVDSDDESCGSSDYHTAPEAPGARVKSWQGMWNIENIDQVRAALRGLRVR